MIRMRILIVDDDMDIRQMVSFLLRIPGVEVVGEAENGQEAIEAVQTLQPDLVVMDYMMPVLGGAEATRQIKEIHPEVAVIGFTAADDQGIQSLLSAGAVAVIDKTNFAALLSVLDQIQKD